jgi:preprotein translocase subunit SecA
MRSYAQKDYRHEYKREAYDLFTQMLERVKFDTASVLMRIEIRSQEELQREEEARQRKLLTALQAQHAEAQSVLGTAAATESERASRSEAAAAETFVREERKVGRNEPCPCGSGKKYKQCHGA